MQHRDGRQVRILKRRVTSSSRKTPLKVPYLKELHDQSTPSTGSAVSTVITQNTLDTGRPPHFCRRYLRLIRIMPHARTTKQCLQPYLTGKSSYSMSQVDKVNETNYYDSVTGKLLYTAPRGRTFEEFKAESKSHGWPSFRDSEVG